MRVYNAIMLCLYTPALGSSVLSRIRSVIRDNYLQSGFGAFAFMQLDKAVAIQAELPAILHGSATRRTASAQIAISEAWTALERTKTDSNAVFCCTARTGIMIVTKAARKTVYEALFKGEVFGTSSCVLIAHF